jgi:TRAP-type mannitol/chloroaromatic compound transport system substrate-binding protein
MKFKSSLLIGAAAVAATSLLALTSHAKNLRWKMQSTWGSQVAINGESAVYFSNKVKEISDGRVQLRFHEPNALVPSLEVWDAVKNGSVDSGYTTPGYHAGKIPAVSYFTAVPFGPGASEYHGWFEYGGGQQLKDELYAKYGLTSQSVDVGSTLLSSLPPRRSIRHCRLVFYQLSQVPLGPLQRARAQG